MPEVLGFSIRGAKTILPPPFDELMAHHSLAGVIGPFYENVRPQCLYERVRGVFFEDDYHVHAAKRSKQSGPFVLGQYRAMHSLDAPYRTVRVEADNQPLPFGGGGMEQPNMARVKNVETPVGKYDAIPGGSQRTNGQCG
jgi:hypothetical protein